ncbi:MAG: hypothetical protein IJ651_00395 [Bacteroidales bacterium]|nr:hypothetical protein [Bacteroidales bacterium]
MVELESKHGIVSRQPYELYMSFTDLQNFQRMLPEDKKDMIQADFDTLTATVQGFHIGVKVHQRVPYSRIELVDYDAPFGFFIELHFEPAREDPFKTEFWIKAQADLNLMMKMMLSGKIKEALDKMVDGLVDASNGKMPEGFDPNMWGGNAK